MTITFTVRIAIDDDTVATLAAKRHRPSADVVAEIVGDVECRLFDSIRYREGLRHVGVDLFDPAQARRQPA